MTRVRLFGDARIMNEIEGVIPAPTGARPVLVGTARELAKGRTERPERGADLPSTVFKTVDRAEIQRFLSRRKGNVADIGVDVPLIPAAVAQGGPSWYLDGLSPLIGKRSQAVDHMHHLDGRVPTDCGNIGVVIFDTGISGDYVDRLGGRFGGGWQMVGPAGSQGNAQDVGRFADPHARMADGHGNMIARNVLSMAPSATIYDVPILPRRVSNVTAYASNVVPLLDLTHAIVTGQPVPGPVAPPRHDHWILVNAWAVATSFADLPGPLAYRDRREHPLNRRFVELARLPNVDVVFAAGNSGAHANDPFAGAYDRGHHRAIWGANGLEEVWTVGAIDVRAQPVAMSSPGPSLQSLLADPKATGSNLKPDLAAPSWFVEDDDASLSNTGTSAASGVLAGYLACLRTKSSLASEPDPANGIRNETVWSDSAGSPLTIREPTS